MGKKESYEDEEMTVELELEDGTVVNCAIITILTVEAKDYIVLLPLDEDGENEDGEVWFYGYAENPDDPNEEPVLEYMMMSTKELPMLLMSIWTVVNSMRSSTITIQRNKESGWEPGTLCCTCKAEKFQVFFCSGHCHIEDPSLFFKVFRILYIAMRKCLLITVRDPHMIEFQSFGCMHGK